jgi:membrane-associated phospholipid phosphatase
MRRALLAAVALLALSAVPTATPTATAAPTPTVERWIQLELELIASHRLNPPRAARALALVSRGMHLASAAPAPDPAVAGAASSVLEYLFPGDGRVREATERARQANAGRSAKLNFALGVLAGKAMIMRAEHDGSDAVWSGTPPTGDGFWVPTPPAFLPPLEPLAGTWRTWNLSSGSQFRPGPPPAYGSPAFQAELDEVYAVSQSLTTEQKRIADFWADGPGTVTPAGHWNAVALDLVRGRNLSTRTAARLFAALNTAQADAFIACWEAKFHYWYLRPVTAVRALRDPGWLSYIVTPPFPGYVSGHSTTSGAAATVLSAFFPDLAPQLSATADEAAISRLYGGIHFRSDNEVGLELGQRVGGRAVTAYGLRH